MYVGELSGEAMHAREQVRLAAEAPGPVARIGVFGTVGCGKSTLLNTLVQIASGDPFTQPFLPIRRPAADAGPSWQATRRRYFNPMFLEEGRGGIVLVDHEGFPSSGGGFNPLDPTLLRRMYDSVLLADAHYCSVLMALDCTLLIGEWVPEGAEPIIDVAHPVWKSWVQQLTFLRDQFQLYESACQF
jgi:hypothetical protein